MTSSVEQGRAAARQPRSAGTRTRLLEAAAALIGELGWARVTTRAVAERAGLPLGAVSYHFRGKQELLTQAALGAVEAVFPISELAAVETLPQLIGSIQDSLDSGQPSHRGLAAVLVETMQEAGRDPVVRERMARLLAEYRRLLTDLLTAEQQRGAVSPEIDPAAVAALLAAAGDGLLLHTLVDPELEAAAPAQTLLHLLTHGPPGAGTGR